MGCVSRDKNLVADISHENFSFNGNFQLAFRDSDDRVGLQNDGTSIPGRPNPVRPRLG
jgi:hypothetical protein